MFFTILYFLQGYRFKILVVLWAFGDIFGGQNKKLENFTNYSGHFRRFSTHIWQNACANTVRHALVCDVYFPFSKIL